MNKFVYMFDEGNASMRDILGGKGANLAEMVNLGLPVPMGFTVSTEACNNYYENNLSISAYLENEIYQVLEQLEATVGKKLGDIDNPLLLSVRSGARASMPGMMDTILNLGLNDETVISLASKTSNERFAYDSYRRFIQMYSDVVMDIDKNVFESIIIDVKTKKGITLDIELDVDDLKEIVLRFKEEYKKQINEDFPSDAKIQLIEAIKAVFKSWNNERAKVYRKLNDIPSSWGTAVNIQMMVFGNMGNISGTGVAFTRNPSTGEAGIFGEYLINAQGEDVVAGIRTPQSIDKLKNDLPECYEEFVKIATLLEDHYKDMQDMEFTIEEGKLYILQTRNGKRTAQAAVKIACDMVNEGKLSKEEALLKIDAKSLDQLLHPTFNKSALDKKEVITTGLAASPGAASGMVVFNATDAKKMGKDGKRVILLREETTPEDIEGMQYAQGILTVTGGMTSHAAVVARGMGVCCVSGASEIKIDRDKKEFSIGNKTYNELDYISIDGVTGNIYEGNIETEECILSDDFKTILSWATEFKKLDVLANADNYKDAKKALELGAKGIGLCRTEHMFFDNERILKMRKMIITNDEEEKNKAILELYKYQKEDFINLYKELKKYPMTVRLLDPPLHEFLPKNNLDIEELAKDMNLDKDIIIKNINELKEVNPMMGHRGVRLLVTYPNLAKMQGRAIIEAAIEVKNELNIEIIPKIMIPLVGDLKEFKYVKEVIEEEINNVFNELGEKIDYKIGTMIEVPRAALVADEIAKEADFFSFGTNDLTQMTYGFSRDDAASFIEDYINKQILEFDPFIRVDEKGVGLLIKIAALKGRSMKEDIELGICGEHGGDYKSIEFFNSFNLNYVSCSPYRIPIAIISAAQAQIKSNK